LFTTFYGSKINGHSMFGCKNHFRLTPSKTPLVRIGTTVHKYLYALIPKGVDNGN
jgi:hypothetical protein